jgi:hypothetical protein
MKPLLFGRLEQKPPTIEKYTTRELNYFYEYMESYDDETEDVAILKTKIDATGAIQTSD